MENIDNKKQIIIDKLEALKQSQFRTVIFGISGSVASIKAKDIVQSLIDLNLNVVLIGTKSALHFINNCGEDYSLTELLSKYGIVKMQKETLQATPIFEMFMEEDEWSAWTKRDDYVLHIELRKLASMLLIAPLSANTMAKISHGICDNLLTNIARCWDFKGKVPFIVAPAMNTMMYEHPLTEKQIENLIHTLGIVVLPTLKKKLMCGDEGYGAMLDVPGIINAVKTELNIIDDSQ